MQPLPFATQSYRHDSLPLSAQRLVNAYLEIQPQDAKTQVPVIGCPGLRRFAVLPRTPIRGMITFQDVLYAVSNQEVYRVAEDGTVTQLGPNGLIIGEGPVSIAENGFHFVIVNGTQGYFSDGTTIAQINDGDFLPASSVTFLDQYLVFSRTNTGQFFLSNIADATAYDALDFATAERKPDNLLRVIADHNELWLFGERSIEVWSDVANIDFPFSRISAAAPERGCAAAFSVVPLDNSLFWLGDDKIVYRANGYTPQRVSTHAVEQAIRSFLRIDDAVAFTYTDAGHIFYVLTFPSVGDPSFSPLSGVDRKDRSGTFVYDATTQRWHERESFNLHRWRASSYARAYDRHIVGDVYSGALFEITHAVHDEDGQPLQHVAVSPVLHNNRDRVRMARYELDIEAGIGLNDGQGSEPEIILDWSDDGGRSWSNVRRMHMGRIGEYRRRAYATQLGQFRQRVMRVRHADPTPFNVYGAYGRVGV